MSVCSNKKKGDINKKLKMSLNIMYLYLEHWNNKIESDFSVF